MNFIIENKTKYIIWTFFNYLWNYSKILSEKIVSWAFFYKASVSPSASRLLRSLVDPRARSLRRHAVYARDDASNAGPKPLRRATGRPLPPVTSSLVCALSADGRGVEEGRRRQCQTKSRTRARRNMPGGARCLAAAVASSAPVDNTRRVTPYRR